MPASPWWERDQLQEFEGMGTKWRMMLGAAVHGVNLPHPSPSPCCSPWAPHSPPPHRGDGRGHPTAAWAESPARASAQRTPIPPASGISLYPPPMPQPRDSHCTPSLGGPPCTSITHLSPGIPLTLSARGVPHFLSPSDPSIPPAHLSLRDFLLTSSPGLSRGITLDPPVAPAWGIPPCSHTSS